MYLIFKIKLYKHQIFSLLCILFINFIFSLIYNLVYLDGMKTFSVNLISDLIRELVLCIFFVYIFWLTNKIISIYLCLFIFGVIGFIISIIILAISTNLPC